MYRSNLREWYEDFKTYFHVIAAIVILAVIYFIISIDWGSGDSNTFLPARSATNVFYQGSQHNLAGIVSNIDLLEERVLRIQLGRHIEEVFLTITPEGLLIPLYDFEDNRLTLEMTLSTSVFWATPVHNERGLFLGVYLEEVGYGMFLERWLLTGEYLWGGYEEMHPCGYTEFC